MERINMEKLMMTLLMLTIVVVAQQRVVADATMAANFQPETSIGTCAKMCDVVYNCTKDCANAIVHFNLEADSESVRHHVDKCYGNCQSKI
ncbi:hypothetical protein V6N13_067644 [Hibiscus sabdariffa]